MRFVFLLLSSSGAPSRPTTVFAWIFTPWALLAVTPVYVYMVRGLENAAFVKAEMEEVARLREGLTPPQGPSVATATGNSFEVQSGMDKTL